jgi:formate dehydrogenase subunit gamma
MKQPAFLPRFSGTERAVHWTYAVCFLTLLATGLVMYLPVLSAFVPSRLILRQLHLAAAFFIITVPTLIGLFGDRRRLVEDARAVDRWDADDRSWMADGLQGLPSEAGRFNAGQKANAAFTVGSLIVFVGTGVIMALNIFTRVLPDWLVGNASLIHDALTWVALFAWLGHVFLAGVYPPTRESLRGMLTGVVRSDWARHHHPRWWAEQMALQAPADGANTPPATTIAPGGPNRHVS